MRNVWSITTQHIFRPNGKVMKSFSQGFEGKVSSVHRLPKGLWLEEFEKILRTSIVPRLSEKFL